MGPEEFINEVLKGKIRKPNSERFVESAFSLTKIVGLYPFESGQRYSKRWLTYSLTLLTLICAVTLYTIVTLKNSNASLYESYLRLCLDRFQIFIASFTASFCIVNIISNGSKLKQCSSSIMKIDEMLGQYGLGVEYSNKGVCVLFSITVTLVFALIPVSYSLDLLTFATMIYNFPQTVSLLVVSGMEYQHHTFMGMISHRFGVLVRRMKSINNSDVSSFGKQAELEALVKIFNVINDVSININEIYGKPILFVVGTIFVVVTSSCNDLVEKLIDVILNEKIFLLPMIAVNGYWVVFRITELWLIISTCERVVKKAMEFSSLLYQCMIEDVSLSISRNKKLYLHISTQKEPHFTAYGFFTLDFSLFHSVIAAATTYLVILVQFSQGNNIEEKNDGSLNFTTSNPIV